MRLIRRNILIALGLFAVLGIAIFSARLSYRYKTISLLYKKIEVGMNETSVATIFDGYHITPLKDNTENNVAADRRQSIFVQPRLFGSDMIIVYYRKGSVVGKCIIGYDPYSADDFPTVLPHNGKEQPNNRNADQ